MTTTPDAPITEEDRVAAHTALEMHPLVAGMRRGDYCAEDWHCVRCDKVARLRRDAREAERAACEGIVEACRKDRAETWDRIKTQSPGDTFALIRFDSQRSEAEVIRDAIARRKGS